MTQPNDPRRDAGTRNPIVSSAHLAAGKLPELSEFEYSLTLAMTAYQRWMVQCMTAAGMPQLSPTEILVLHTIRHRDRAKRLADIALVLNIEETHLVTYAVRKLEGLKLISTKRAGKEKMIEVTKSGVDVCSRYASLREDILVASVNAAGTKGGDLSELATLLRSLSGLYNQSARAAATV